MSDGPGRRPGAGEPAVLTGSLVGQCVQTRSPEGALSTSANSQGWEESDRLREKSENATTET